MFKLGSGKNNKQLSFCANVFQAMIPYRFFRRRLIETLKEVDDRPDRDAILDRVAYYNRLSKHTPVGDDAPRLDIYRFRGHSFLYYFDAQQLVRWFSPEFRWRYFFCDRTTDPDLPSIVKARPIINTNENSVLLKLKKVRHFVRLKDDIPFAQKRNQAIFRGVLETKTAREDFFKKCYNHPLLDLGGQRLTKTMPKEWARPKISLWKHLKYKFVFALEGYDVATNLKWIMSSQSVAVMPRPNYETWFMEGRLMPEKHYIEIKPDFSDVEEKLTYYIEHPDEAVKITKNAHEHWEQFLDPRRELLIQLLVLDKYFRMTN